MCPGRRVNNLLCDGIYFSEPDDFKNIFDTLKRTKNKRNLELMGVN